MVELLQRQDMTATRSLVLAFLLFLGSRCAGNPWHSEGCCDQVSVEFEEKNAAYQEYPSTYTEYQSDGTHNGHVTYTSLGGRAYRGRYAIAYTGGKWWIQSQSVRGQLKGKYVTEPSNHSCPSAAGYTWTFGGKKAGRGLVVKCKTDAPQAMWHSNGRCGMQYPLPLTDGSPSQCDPNANADRKGPCCSSVGWCGNSDSHCKCSGCKDYRPTEEETETSPVDKAHNRTMFFVVIGVLGGAVLVLLIGFLAYCHYQRRRRLKEVIPTFPPHQIQHQPPPSAGNTEDHTYDYVYEYELPERSQIGGTITQSIRNPISTIETYYVGEDGH